MKTLKDLKRKKPREIKTVLGVDASTNSMAFCLFKGGKPVKWGEIDFHGDNVFERLADGQRKVSAIRKTLEADMVVFESAVYVQNKKTVILLAYAFGAVISALMRMGAEIDEVSPIAWQNFIGNKALNKAEKEAIKKEFPDKSTSWYSSHNREIRKQRTMDWVKKTYGITVESDNISDAIGVAHFGYQKHVVVK